MLETKEEKEMDKTWKSTETTELKIQEDIQGSDKNKEKKEENCFIGSNKYPIHQQNDTRQEKYERGQKRC